MALNIITDSRELAPLKTGQVKHHWPTANWGRTENTGPAPHPIDGQEVKERRPTNTSGALFVFPVLLWAKPGPLLKGTAKGRCLGVTHKVGHLKDGQLFSL